MSIRIGKQRIGSARSGMTYEDVTLSSPLLLSCQGTDPRITRIRTKGAWQGDLPTRRMKEELESHQEKGEEGLDWVKPDVTLSSPLWLTKRFVNKWVTHLPQLLGYRIHLLVFKISAPKILRRCI